LPFSTTPAGDVKSWLTVSCTLAHHNIGDWWLWAKYPAHPCPARPEW
jgi:hypothetical protein